MKNEHDRLCILFGVLLALAWAIGSDEPLWRISRLIPAIIFGIGVSYSLIKRLTPLTHGVVNFLMLPLLICLVGLAVSEGGAIRGTSTAIGALVAFLSLRRIVALRLEEETLRDSKVVEGV